MSPSRLNRRAVIRGAGSIAIALPWLEIMGTPRANAQAPSAASRCLLVYTPGGTQQQPINGSQRFWPGGSETAPIYSPILAPLEPMKSRIVTIRGLYMACANVGENGSPHGSGSIGIFTGGSKGSPAPSIDQLLAPRLSQGKKKASLQMAVRWASGLYNGNLATGNCVTFENPSGAMIAPSIDPVAIYADLFGQLAPATPSTSAAPEPSIQRKKSILDFTDKEYVSLAARLGPSDKAKLEQHLEKLREVEKELTVTVTASGHCGAPAKVDTSKYRPNEGIYAENDNAGLESGTDGMIPTVGRYMTDMMIMAMACDITAVGLLQWSDSECQYSLPWLNLLQHRHYYHHEGTAYAPAEVEQFCTWDSEQHLYMLQQMAAMDMGGHSLLDETVVLFGSEIGWPETHAQDNIPIMVAGGPQVRGGRHLDFRINKGNDNDTGIAHNNVLVSVLNLCGDPRTSCGDAQFCNNPINLA